MNKTALNH